MDKITVDMRLATGPQTRLTLVALMLYAAKHPEMLNDLMKVEGDFWQHIGMTYTSAEAANAAECLMKTDDALVRGSVLWTPKVLTVSLRGRVAALAGDIFKDGSEAAQLLAADYPPGVLDMQADAVGVRISRDGTRLPACWLRFGRVVACSATEVRMAWVAKAAV